MNVTFWSPEDAGCPLESELLAFQAGELPASVLAEISAHVDECPTCFETINTFQEASDVLAKHLREEAKGSSLEFTSTPDYKAFETFALGLSLKTAEPAVAPAPEMIGPYVVERQLGQGGFASVYLAQDSDRNRRVAIKVPRIRTLNDASTEALLEEAQTLAKLEHPAIVSVFDWGRMEDGRCFVVMEYIEGEPLNKALRSRSLSRKQLVELTIEIAQALHQTHRRKLVHRDIKPSNIILDENLRPKLIDFGLAIHDDDQWQHRGELAGTRPYLAPEQVRREAHRLDGRTDVWALGVVLYELLTGQRPFRSEKAGQLEEEILRRDPKPLRQIDDTIPPNLERICLKCLSRTMTGRYNTALDLSHDLQEWLENDAEKSATGARLIVPRGLRAFGKDDADFYLQLLPGPRDSSGLPEIIQFWKSTLGSHHLATTCPVGLIYGPSGSGKSSLVNAGILPQLDRSVVPIHVESTADETELWVRNGLKTHFPRIPQEPPLAELLLSFRQGNHVPIGRKVLLVFDQFERWLHSVSEYEHSELVKALRQCDGQHVQALIIVRDDFWMAVTRFFKALEIKLVDGQNASAVDRFDQHHGRKVLEFFGRGYETLPAPTVPLDAEQQRFVNHAVESIAHEDGTVVGVRLALFAEMMKSLPWNAATSRHMGDADAIGERYLTATFGSGGKPNHRLHAKTAQHVLRLLLPTQGIDIGGHRKSHSELMEATECSESELTAVLDFLNLDLRLITPIDQHDGDNTPDVTPTTTQTTYQLTHDFLVPAIRKWVRRSQMATRRGRAEIQLQDRTKLWLAYREKKQLPTTSELISIRAFTNSADWTKPQREMIRRTTALHGIRWTAVILASVALAVVVGLVIQRDQNSQQERVFAQVDRILKASAANVQEGIQAMKPLQEQAIGMVSDRFKNDSTPVSQRLRAAMVLSAFGKKKHEFIVGHIQTAPADEVPNIVRALGMAPKDSLEELRAAFKKSQDNIHKAQLATVALHLGDANLVQAMLTNRPYPTSRSIFIHSLPSWHGDITDLVQASCVETDPDYRSGVCLTLGDIGPTPEQLQRIAPVVEDWYQTHPDGGTHSAAGWLLRRWGRPLPTLTASDGSQVGDKEWYLNETGMTMIRLAGEGGSRPYFLSATEVSRAVYQQFVNDKNYPIQLKPVRFRGAAIQKSPSLQHPVQKVGWVDAALFCNWLSVKEGLSPCYDTNGIATIMANSDLELIRDANGYRIPFEHEWEFACRAGTDSVYFFGDDTTLLSDYAVFGTIKTDPCATKRPNPWGFFDMPGNVNEWCQDIVIEEDSSKLPASPTEEPDEAQASEETRQYVVRSGAFEHDAGYTTSWRRQTSVPYRDTHTMGLRVARNIPR